MLTSPCSTTRRSACAAVRWSRAALAASCSRNRQFANGGWARSEMTGQPAALLADAVHAGAREPVYIEPLTPGLAGGAERRIVLPDDGQLVVHP